MKTIKVSNLKRGKTISGGSYSYLLATEYEGKKYAYKEFLCPSELLKRTRKKKLNEISQLDLKGSILPMFWVKDCVATKGYLMDLYSKVSIDELEIKDRINCLRNLKNSILELHENKIIHADIHMSNFIYDKKDVFLIDFDNSSYKGKGIDYNLLNTHAKKFVDNYGITSDLDIFLFNILTYSTLNDIYYYHVIEEISKTNTYGFFDGFDCSDVIKSLTLKEKSFNNDFLIDRIK